MELFEGVNVVDDAFQRHEVQESVFTHTLIKKVVEIRKGREFFSRKSVSIFVSHLWGGCVILRVKL